MSTAHSFLVGWLVVEAITTVAQVGKPRKPLSPGEAAGQVAAWLAMIALVVLG